MTGAELRVVRKLLGLTIDTMADMLNVREDTLRRWETDREQVPIRVADEVQEIERQTTAAGNALIAALQAMNERKVIVYRTDEDFRAARPEYATFTAEWWLALVARVSYVVPRVRIEWELAR